MKLRGFLLLLTAGIAGTGLAAAPTPILEVSRNGHYLTKDGKPFFWMGDTAWSLVNLYTAEEAEAYLEHRRGQGFNVVHVMLLFDGGPGLETAAADQTRQLPFEDMNPATPNDAYFQNVDRLVETARRKDLILAVMPCGGSSGSFVKKKKIITKETARAYGAWLGRRYKDSPNIIWANGFDLRPWEYEDVAREFAAGLGEGDGGSHLISYHPSGGASSSHFHNEPWLAMNFIQTWADFTKIHPMVHADYLRQPAKPVIHAEGAYEEGPEYPTGPITPLVVRRQAYWAVLAGGFHTYGHNDMWRKNPTWRRSLEAPGALAMGVLKTIFTSREWWELVPDQSVFSTSAGEGKTLNAAARSEDGGTVIVYLSSPAGVTINMSRLTAGPRSRATWVNPVTGKGTNGGEFPNKGARRFVPPELWEDAVLVLEAVQGPR